MSASPIPSGTNSPAPKKSTGSVDYLALDFQPSSPSPHRKVPGVGWGGGQGFGGGAYAPNGSTPLLLLDCAFIRVLQGSHPPALSTQVPGSRHLVSQGIPCAEGQTKAL